MHIYIYIYYTYPWPWMKTIHAEKYEGTLFVFVQAQPGYLFESHPSSVNSKNTFLEFAMSPNKSRELQLQAQHAYMVEWP
jgi:hypothetical protein